MPQTKTQGIVFGLLMSVSMTLGMEFFVSAMKAGGLTAVTNSVFRDALIGTSYMWIFAFVLSELFGNKFGAYFANKHFDPRKDNPYIYRLARQAGTTAVMCPSMSLAAALFCRVFLGGEPIAQLPAMWVGMVFRNFPIAFLWCMFAAAPFTNWAFHAIFDKVNAKKEAKESKSEKVKAAPVLSVEKD